MSTTELLQVIEDLWDCAEHARDSFACNAYVRQAHDLEDELERRAIEDVI